MHCTVLCLYCATDLPKAVPSTPAGQAIGGKQQRQYEKDAGLVEVGCSQTSIPSQHGLARSQSLAVTKVSRQKPCAAARLYSVTGLEQYPVFRCHIPENAMPLTM